MTTRLLTLALRLNELRIRVFEGHNELLKRSVSLDAAWSASDVPSKVSQLAQLVVENLAAAAIPLGTIGHFVGRGGLMVPPEQSGILKLDPERVREALAMPSDAEGLAADICGLTAGTLSSAVGGSYAYIADPYAFPTVPLARFQGESPLR